MARSHVAVALTSALLGVLLVLQLYCQYKIPGFDYEFKLGPGPTNSPRPDAPKVPLNPSLPEIIKLDRDEYLLGVGKADITGPVVEVNLMGYADPKQLGTGLRQRLYSRAFIVGDAEKPAERFVYLVLDTQSGDTAIRHGILEGLRELGDEYALYGQNNVAVTGTHSHSGPGAWLNYLLPQITSKGFSKQSYDAIVTGALLSIRRAHASLAMGRLEFGSTEIHGANVNRSPYAYLANPHEERVRYENDVDKTMTMLKFTRSEDGKELGVLTWFPVHGTSMLGNNTLVSGDNKGVAAYLFEKQMRHKGHPDFVAGFSQANVGDTSPNVLGAFCEDGSGEQCKFEDSTCGGRNEPCHGRGPYFGLDDGGTKSCFEIGRRQYEGALKLYQSLISNVRTSIAVRGGAVKSLHTFRDFSNLTFPLSNGSVVSTCPAALGYSFAAGTTDGPGAFDFKQNNSGDPNASPVWAAVSRFIHAPSEEQKACHSPKPILLDVGETTRPYLWTPNIVDIQMFRVGQLFIIISPGEATTMAGRRWKDAVHSAAADLLKLDDRLEEPLVVLGGPANSYTHYISTPEEYDIQRYEGASTLYGRWTLPAYIHTTTDLLAYLSKDQAPKVPLPVGPLPPIHTNKSLSFINGVVYDRSGFFRSFGDVLQDVEKDGVYRPNTVVQASFVGANPRNNLRLEQTFASVSRLELDSGTWHTERTDADWDLVYTWKRTSEVGGTSEVTISWEIPEDAASGTYRLEYYGDSKAVGSGKITSFSGVSSNFRIVM